jgi:transcriptional regulator with XRE-family HTH domain
VLDELAGAGAGDARRSMSNKNVNLARSWQLMRKKRIVTITTLPHWSDADKRMRRFADYRVWCLERPIGYFRPYKVTSTFDDGDVKTERYDDVQRIKFPNLDSLEDPYFRDVTEKKDALLESEAFDADALLEEEVGPEEAERNQKVADAQRARDTGLSTTEVAEVVDMSQSWVSKYTDPPPPADDETPADD